MLASAARILKTSELMLHFYPEEQREMRQGRQDGPVGGGVNVRLGFLSRQQSETGLKVCFGGRV